MPNNTNTTNKRPRHTPPIQSQEPQSLPQYNTNAAYTAMQMQMAAAAAAQQAALSAAVYHHTTNTNTNTNTNKSGNYTVGTSAATPIEIGGNTNSSNTNNHNGAQQRVVAAAAFQAQMQAMAAMHMNMVQQQQQQQQQQNATRFIRKPPQQQQQQRAAVLKRNPPPPSSSSSYHKVTTNNNSSAATASGAASGAASGNSSAPMKVSMTSNNSNSNNHNLSTTHIDSTNSVKDLLPSSSNNILNIHPSSHTHKELSLTSSNTVSSSMSVTPTTISSNNKAKQQDDSNKIAMHTIVDKDKYTSSTSNHTNHSSKKTASMKNQMISNIKNKNLSAGGGGTTTASSSSTVQPIATSSSSNSNIKSKKASSSASVLRKSHPAAMESIPTLGDLADRTIVRVVQDLMHIFQLTGGPFTIHQIMNAGMVSVKALGAHREEKVSQIFELLVAIGIVNVVNNNNTTTFNAHQDEYVENEKEPAAQNRLSPAKTTRQNERQYVFLNGLPRNEAMNISQLGTALEKYLNDMKESIERIEILKSAFKPTQSHLTEDSRAKHGDENRPTVIETLKILRSRYPTLSNDPLYNTALSGLGIGSNKEVKPMEDITDTRNDT